MNEKLQSIKEVIEKASEKATWRITKYANDKDYKAGKFYEEVRFIENILVNQGINEVFTLIASDSSGTRFANAYARLVVGTGTSAAAATDVFATFTSGTTKIMMAGFPTYGTDQKAVWKSSFGGDEANQAWDEFGVLNQLGGSLLNRKVSSQGTKISGQTWELELEISLS